MKSRKRTKEKGSERERKYINRNFLRLTFLLLLYPVIIAYRTK